MDDCGAILTIHAFVSKLAQMAAAVVAQPTGPVNAGGVWSTGLCGGSGYKKQRKDGLV